MSGYFIDVILNFGLMHTCTLCINLIIIIITDPDIQRGILEGHTDAIWDLVLNQSNGLLASASADGRCILWDPVNSSQVKCITSEEG